MAFSASATAPARRDLNGLWESIDHADEKTPRSIDISPSAVLDSPWCSVRRVSLGTQPHRVRFRSPSHTLMVFDQGSFVDGERWINGVRAGTPGPLDRGIDVVPANVELVALAGAGSNITATLISIYEEETPVSRDVEMDRQANLTPALSLGGEFLNVLTARVRQVMQEGHDPRYLETIISLLFQEVIRAQSDSATLRECRTSGGLSPRTRRLVREFLHQNLDKAVDLDGLASYVGLSRFHFTREFKASFGVPPHKYLLNLRIQRASELLRTTKSPITDIALDVGFSCSSDFSRAFKQILNCSPREFRSLHRCGQGATSGSVLTQ